MEPEHCSDSFHQGKQNYGPRLGPTPDVLFWPMRLAYLLMSGEVRCETGKSHGIKYNRKKELGPLA